MQYCKRPFIFTVLGQLLFLRDFRRLFRKGIESPPQNRPSVPTPNPRPRSSAVVSVRYCLTFLRSSLYFAFNFANLLISFPAQIHRVPGRAADTLSAFGRLLPAPFIPKDTVFIPKVTSPRSKLFPRAPSVSARAPPSSHWGYVKVTF